MKNSSRSSFDTFYLHTASLGSQRLQDIVGLSAPINNHVAPVKSAAIFAVLFGCFILIMSSVADAYGASTTITLDRLPDSVYAGQQVTFTGTLASEYLPLSGGIVTICEDDPFKPDECLASGITDHQGRYAIEWTAKAGIEVDFDIYAEFKSVASYSSSQTSRQTMSVLKHVGSLMLDPIPGRAAYGEAVAFTGTLQLDGHSHEGAVVYIKDEDLFGFDDLLTSAYVDHTGHFTAYWIVEDVDPDDTIDIQAVYESNSLYYRVATPIQKLSIYDGPPALTRPDPSPVGGDGYIELYRSLDFDKPPRVAIVPSPDSYGQIRKHIVPVQEGILRLTSMLERQYGDGVWDVDFEVVLSGESFSVRPDVIVNLVTRDNDSNCDWDRYGGGTLGWARILASKPVPTTVCSFDDRTDDQIGATAGHEFAHAIGLGHTFNVPGDRMCSTEDGYGETCPGSSSKSATFSVLNLDALVAIYGTDGFQNPNNHVTYKEKFRLGSQNDQVSPPDQGYTITPTPEISYQTTGTVYTDFEQYWEGEVVLVDGVFLEAYEGEILELSMTNHSGDLIDWVPVLVEDGQFVEFFYTSFAGTYYILLHDDEYDLVASTPFDVAGSTDAVIFTDSGYYELGETILIDGFYWGSYDGPSTIVVYGPDWYVVDRLDVDVVEDFFETYTPGYSLPGRYAVEMYDQRDDFVASTAFIVYP